MEEREQILRASGARVAQFRKRLGLSQEGLGFEAGLDRTYISGIERGIRNPTLTSMYQIADALKVSLSVLLVDVPEE